MDISVVIPTWERPEAVRTAVESALAQRLRPREIIVVIDGSESVAATRAALEPVAADELRIIEAGTRLGNGDTRNLGIAAARGEWIALLDDDDLWYPHKLARQCRAIKASDARDGPGVHVASCRVRARSASRDFIWPRLLPRDDEPIDHYLFCRRWPMSGDRLMQTSTLLAPAALFRSAPFCDEPRFVDQDWLLRVCRRNDVRITFASGDEPLVDWHLAHGGSRVSHGGDWRWCVGWADRRRALLDRRSRAAFLLTLASARAADAGDREAFFALLQEAFSNGRPAPVDVLSHFLNFMLSRGWRDSMAGRVDRWLARR